MNSAGRMVAGLVGVLLLLAPQLAQAADWSQWRGANRDGRADGFNAPATWPAELTNQWTVRVGDGVGTPALVGDRLYVFARQDGQEVTRCLDASSGSEIWKDSYDSEPATGSAGGFAGPRSSPTVADGKVVTLGVRGVLSCLDAASGEFVWRKDDFAGSWPRFFTSSSPIVVGGLCIAQLGGGDDGGIVAYDLATGEEKWKWPGGGPAYASPVLMNVDGANVVLAVTERQFVGIEAASGDLLWEIQYSQGHYNAATPITDGQTVILAGPGSGMTAIAVEMQGGELAEQEVWKNTDNTVQFNSPVLKDDLIYGLSNNNTLFAINAHSSETAWSTPLGGAAAAQEGGGGFGGRGGFGGFGGRGFGGQGDRGGRGGDGGQGGDGDRGGQPGEGGQSEAAQAADQAADGAQTQRGRSAGQGGRRGFFGGGRRRGGGRRGYGSIVDAGSVLLVLTPAAELVVFEPSDQEFKEVARYKVSETPTYAYPVPSDNRVYIKDQDSVTLWTVE